MTARCVEKSCPVRWRTGQDRACREHADDERAAVADAAEALGIVMQAAPGNRDEQDDHGAAARHDD